MGRLLLSLACLAATAAGAGEARYTVRLAQTSPPRFRVTAVLPAGSLVRMDTTRPGDLPALLEHGWPALVSDLRVTGGEGRPVPATSIGAEGWRLPDGIAGPLTVTYEVGTDALAAAGWPAPREAVHVEEGAVSIVGRALFVAGAPDQKSTVTFALPAGWQAVAPWTRKGESFTVASTQRLQENLIVFTRSAPEEVRAGDFRVLAVPLGPWGALRKEVSAAIQADLTMFVRFLPVGGPESYVALLLPMPDQGAESYRQSLALTYPEAPTAANRRAWSNLLAHEIFHYWNGWAMAPADYGRSQWFQEGFTEYAANMALVGTGGMSAAQFRECLAAHVANARRLTTTLEETGGRKGPPLYSAGALVAFAWDTRIEEATEGKKDLRDFFKALWTRTERGRRAWERADLIAALNATAPGPWDAFLDTYVKGTTTLPYAEILQRAGLRLVEDKVEEDPAASASAKRVWARLSGKR